MDKKACRQQNFCRRGYERVQSCGV